MFLPLVSPASRGSLSDELTSSLAMLVTPFVPPSLSKALVTELADFMLEQATRPAPMITIAQRDITWSFMTLLPWWNPSFRRRYRADAARTIGSWSHQRRRGRVLGPNVLATEIARFLTYSHSIVAGGLPETS